jgi:hypothetical protein
MFLQSLEQEKEKKDHIYAVLGKRKYHVFADQGRRKNK